MNPKVQSIELAKVKKALENCPQIVKDYVRSLETILQKETELKNTAITKLKGLTRRF